MSAYHPVTLQKYPITKKFVVMGHEVELIQFKLNDVVNIRVKSNTPDDSEIPFNVMRYVRNEGMATEKFLTNQK